MRECVFEKGVVRRLSLHQGRPVRIGRHNGLRRLLLFLPRLPWLHAVARMDEVDVFAQPRANAQIDGMPTAGAPMECVEHFGGDWHRHHADVLA